MSIVYEFGPFTLDTQRPALLRGDDPVLIPGKALEVLQVLLERRGQVVEKEQLMDLVWPDATVEDANLTQTIFILRKALGDSRERPSYIATVARRGYRFVADVREVHRPTGRGADSRSEPQLLPNSLAVLPFSLLGISPDDEYLGLGLADALITRLSNIPEILVRPTSSVRRHMNTANVFALGRQLRVDALVEGTVQRLGDRIRVTVQLVDLRRSAPVWAERFEQGFTDLFTLQDNIAARIVQSLAPRVTTSGRSRLATRATENGDAYNAYLKGRYHWNKRTLESLTRAIDFFRVAIERDPNYALAYLGLADCYVVLDVHGWILPREAVSQGRAAALRALELDDGLAEAHAALAAFLAVPECNWAGAEQAYRRALELAPNDGKTRNWYANLLAAVRRLEEAVVEAKHAVRLDPLNLAWNMGVGHMLYLARRYEDAIEQELRTLEMDEHFAMAHWILGLCYEQVGRLSESIDALRRAEQYSGHNAFMHGLFGRANALAGRPDDARAVLNVVLAGNESGYVPADAVAVIHAGLGDRDSAFQWLNRAVDYGCYSITFLAVSPLFDSLRDDPRFDRLLRRLNLI